MDDLKMLSDLGQSLDHEPPATLVRQRQRLVEATGGRRNRSWALRWRLPLAAGLAAGVAVTGVVLVGSGSGHTTGPPPPTRLDAATTVLNRAAGVVETQPDPAPKPHQWIYEKAFEYGGGPKSPPTSDENWERFDGREEAFIQNGRLEVDQKHTMGKGDTGTVQGAYDVLRALPADPKAALAVLDREVGTQYYGGAAPGKAGLLFANISQLLRNSPIGAPPKVQATLYRVLAMIPGVRVQTNMTDGLGHHDIGVTQGNSDSYLLLDPATYKVIGFQNVWAGKAVNEEIGKAKHVVVNYPAGTITYGQIITAVFVSGPGKR
jgi:hypothetical protein